MFKKIFGLLCLSLTFIIPAQAANLYSLSPGLAESETHEAIVKIITYTRDINNRLINITSGSGVIISPNGHILTNNHVISIEDAFDNEKETSYQICITTDTSSPPLCNFTAELLGKNKDLDIAVLKIQAIPGVSFDDSQEEVIHYEYPSLSLALEEPINVGDNLKIYGYPSIGDNTITITNGQVSGTLDKHNKNWIKTDAIVSYGNSGGAALNENNRLIGIPTMIYNDTASSLGYILSIDDVSEWLRSNLDNIPIKTDLYNQTVEFIKHEYKTNKSNLLTNLDPSFTITKPEEWEWFNYGETIWIIHNPTDEDGGFIGFAYTPTPYEYTKDNLFSYLKWDNADLDEMATFRVISSNTIASNNVLGLNTIYSVDSEINLQQLYPIDNYVLYLFYTYGKNDKDKKIIDDTLNSLNLIPKSPKTFVEEKSYINQEPTFAINVSGRWALQSFNNASKPIRIAHKDYPDSFVLIKVKKRDSVEASFTNETRLENMVIDANDLFADGYYNLDIDFTNTEANYKLNTTINNIINYSLTLATSGDSNVIYYENGFMIPHNSYEIIIELDSLTEDKASHDEFVKEAILMLQSFSLTTLANPIVTTIEPITPQPVVINPVIVKPIATPLPMLAEQITNTNMFNRLRGKIILTVQENGEAYYINPVNQYLYSLGRPKDAFTVMREQGIGIINADLEKIEISLDYLQGTDTDQDGLPDDLEIAIHTDPNKVDTDGDGKDDKAELEAKTDPNKAGANLTYDTNFTTKQLGKIFLQVENNGEAWYINPVDSKRYFMGRPGDAFALMRNLGLGISTNDYNSLTQ